MLLKLVFLLAVCGHNAFAIDYPEDACGLRPLIDPPRNSSSRIVGGFESVRGDWPWAISMQRQGSHICGGSLINNQWIVTAAHCLAGNTNPLIYTIVFGAHDRLISDPWVIKRSVSSIIIHPNYNSQNFANDIALMKLSAVVKPYTEHYMPICFPGDNQVFEGQTGHTVGWGASYYGGSILRYKSEVATPILSDTACRARYNAGMINPAYQICSGGSNKGACQGDSGGPFIVADPTRGGRYVLAGLTSWGIGCGQGGVYTRLSYYRPWIESHAGSVLS